MIQLALFKPIVHLQKRNMNCQVLTNWPEPIVRVQSLSQSGQTTVPARYVKPLQQRPNIIMNESTEVEVPIIDLSKIWGDSHDEGGLVRAEEMEKMGRACREWGFFQAVNHGVSDALMRRVREVWREFFEKPVEVKQRYGNSPSTYEGYGSRVGTEKDAILDWCDYFFLYYMPVCLRNPSRWPSLPPSCRELINEYGCEVTKLGGKLMEIFSENLGLQQDYLMKAFGGEEQIGGCMRANFYPKCPQPDLTLGLSSHSDPGGITILLPDDTVPGLQVRHRDAWVTVNSIPNAFIVNIADQLQIMSNGIYKSVEHRVMVNSIRDRISLAFFYNPKEDVTIEPAKELVSHDCPALYRQTSFEEHRRLIRTQGPSGKAPLESVTTLV